MDFRDVQSNKAADHDFVNETGKIRSNCADVYVLGVQKIQLEFCFKRVPLKGL